MKTVGEREWAEGDVKGRGSGNLGQDEPTEQTHPGSIRAVLAV